MDKREIYQKLNEQHQELMAYLSALSDEAIHQQKEGKWSALQNMDHLLKSMQVANSALSKPTFLLRRMFGKPNRPARTYEALVNRYQERLAQRAAAAPKEFAAGEAQALDRVQIIRAYDKQVQKFLKFVERVKESKLDTTLLPHPLMGKLLMREVLYFMHYHTEHHIKAIKISAQ